jgi:2'-5' RNA ligase
MPRLFAALSIPAEVASALAAARGGVFGARWIEPGDYHVTLRFVGDVDVHAAREVADALAAVRRPPVTVDFQGLSWFGGDKPRAIVARIRPSPPLVELQGDLERRLRRVGLPPRRIRRAFVRGPALCPLFGARLGGRRAVSGRGGLPAAIVPRGSRSVSCIAARR